MKIETRSAIFILLLVVLQVNIDYLSTMGMYWGFSTNDIFWFTMNYTGEFDDLVDCDVYLQAKWLNNISLSQSGISELGLEPMDIGVYYNSSGTFTEMSTAMYRIVLSYHRVEFGGISSPRVGLYTPLAFPLGNLSYLANLVSEMYGQNNVTVLESKDYWGFEVTYSVFQNFSSVYLNWNVTMQAYLDYSKNDGFLAHYHGLTTYVDSGDVFQEVTLERDGLDWQTMTPFSNTTPVSLYYEQLVQGMYMTAGIAWIIAIVFIVFDYKKRISLIK